MTTNPPITLTDRAAAAIRARIELGPAGTAGVRLSIRTTGCSGNSYHMEFAGKDSISEDDRVEKDGAILFISRTESWMLFGTIVDYVSDDLGCERFVFTNPNEKGRCGCGESFQVEK